LLRGAARAGDDEHAGGIPVQPMHESRFLALLARPGFEHLVDVPVEARAALDREAGRLVEHDHLGVLVQHHARKQFGVRGVAQIPPRDRPRLHILGVDAERRNADRLPGLHARIGFRARAIDADLPGPQELLQRTEAQLWEMHLEPAVEAHA
jgi:hypothetical protein